MGMGVPGLAAVWVFRASCETGGDASRELLCGISCEVCQRSEGPPRSGAGTLQMACVALPLPRGSAAGRSQGFADRDEELAVLCVDRPGETCPLCGLPWRQRRLRALIGRRCENTPAAPTSRLCEAEPSACRVAEARWLKRRLVAFNFVEAVLLDCIVTAVIECIFKGLTKLVFCAAILIWKVEEYYTTFLVYYALLFQER